MTNYHLRRHRRFKDVEIYEEELWSEAGSWGVHCWEKTDQSGFKVPLQTHEERDEVTQLLETAGGQILNI